MQHKTTPKSYVFNLTRSLLSIVGR